MRQELNRVILDDYSSDGAGLITYQNRQTAMSDGAQTVQGIEVLCVKLTKYRLVGSDEE